MTEPLDPRRRDFDDQQNELAGRENGRMARFGVGISRAQKLKEKERKERAYRDALDRLLLDPEYRRLYEELGEKLGSAEIEADIEIARILEQLQQVEQDIELMESKAARDPDGNLVLQFDDGRVVYADGSEVPADVTDCILWPPGAPSAEDYFAAKDNHAALQVHLQDWLAYRNDVLGGIRDRYDDPDNPFEDKDGLRGALTNIHSQRPSLQTLSAPIPVEVSVDTRPVSEFSLPTQLR